MKTKILTVLFLLFGILQTHAQAELALGEFFWDTDPGHGNGILLINLETENKSEIDSTFLVEFEGLTPGNHILYVRFKDKDGNWSQPKHYFVMISPEERLIGQDPADLRKVEYAWDNDTPVELEINAVQNYEFEKSIPTTNLGIGAHQLSLRFKDPFGYWGKWYQYSVFVESEAPGSNITKVEYFLNTDPGIDLATNVDFSPAVGSDVTADFEPSTTGLPQGLNILTSRVKDASGRWSAFYTKPFVNDNTFTLTAENLNTVAFCETVAIPVPFSTTGVFPSENTFKLQLSDINGDNFVDLPSTKTGNTLNATIPSGLAGGFGYRVRIVSTLPLMRSTSATVLIIKNKPHVSVSGTQTINFEQSANLSITANGALPITYTLNGETTVVQSTNTTKTVSPTITTYYSLTTAQNECGIGAVNSAPAVITVICPTTLVHDTGTLPSSIYQAATTIVSQKKAVNNPLSYRAGNSITLQPGFEVSGSVFQAQIGGCL